jgi:hypothetical protein
MKLPSNTSLPFFAYGLYKPGQLCFFRIHELVNNVRDTKVEGILKERDAIPLLIPSKDSQIKGMLIYFHQGKEIEAYNRIIEIEPEGVYRWGQVNTEANVTANVFYGKRIDRGCSDLEHFTEWDGRSDPFFSTALDEIELILKQNYDFSWDCKPLLRLQMAYSLLWTALERYAGLRYHLGKKVNDKVYQIAEERIFIDSLKKYVRSSRCVYNSVDLTKITLNSEDPENSIRYYYQVRSNAIHRGKAVTRDFDILKSSLEELLAIFRELLSDAWNIKS